MKLNNFEKYIRDTFRSQEEDVDVSKIMNAVHAADQKKNYTYWFWIGGALLLGFAGLGLFNFTEDNSLSSNSEIHSNTKSISLNTSTKLTTLNNSNNKLESSTEKIIDNHKTQSTASKWTENQNPTINSFETSSRAINSRQTKVEINSSKIQSEILQSNQAINQTIGSFETTVKTQSKETFSKNIKLNNKYISNVNTGGISSGILAPLNIEQQSIMDQLNPRQVNCPAFRSNPWMFEIGAGTGLSNPTKNLELKDVQSLPAYSYRSVNERSLEGLDFEFFLSAKRARWPISLKSGFNYSRFTERMDLQQNYFEVDTVQGVISTTVSQSGDTITYIYGDIYVEKEYQIKKTKHYFLHQLDIPLSIVFEKEFGNHSLLIEGGTRINFYTLAKGQIFKQNAEFTSVSRPNYFKRLTGLSYFGKLHYRYYLNPKQFLGVQSYYHHIPADFSSNNNGVSQNYFNYGIGVYYGFRF